MSGKWGNDASGLPEPPKSYRKIHRFVGPLLQRLGLSCQEAYRLSAAKMDRELSRSEHFRLRIHLLMCAYCRPLPGQFERLRDLVKQIQLEDERIGDKGESPGLSEEEKAGLRRRLLEMEREF